MRTGIVLIALLALCFADRIDPTSLKVWIIPSILSADYTNMFVNTSAWDRARSRSQVFGFNTMNIDGSHNWGNNNLDNFVAVNAFEQLTNWNLPITIGPSPIQTHDCTASNAMPYFKDMYNGVLAHGGKLLVIDMGEPLTFGMDKPCNYDVPTCVRITAQYMADVRAFVPEVVIGDTEAYPFIDIPKAIMPFVQQMHDVGANLEWFHLDINWQFMYNQMAAGAIDPLKELPALAALCKSLNIPYGVIIDDLTAENDFDYWNKTLTNFRWLQYVHGNDLGGMQMLFMSWNYAPPTPLYNIPETQPYTMTYGVNYMLDLLAEAEAANVKLTWLEK